MTRVKRAITWRYVVMMLLFIVIPITAIFPNDELGQTALIVATVSLASIVGLIALFFFRPR